MNPYAYIILASLSPIGELRAAIPLGLAWHLNLNIMMLIAITANLAVVPLCFIAMKLVRFRTLIHKLFGKRITKKIAKHRNRFEMWGELTLIPFVAIPLPGTGAYTGVLIAEFLGLNRLKSSLAIAIGVCIAGALTLLISVGIISFI